MKSTQTLAVQDTAAALLTQYAVWGKYYSRTLGGADYAMRSHLELFSHSINPEAAITGAPDAVAVMMNPGGSQPLPALASIHGYLPAKPDTTQYQLMRVMRRVGWRHVRVVNLSDFRAPKSADFIRFLAATPIDMRHSLFDASHAAELAHTINGAQGVVLGWGIAPVFEPLARQVLAALPPSLPRYGLRGAADWVYKHPLPLAQHAGQRAWVELVSQQILGNTPQ